MPKATTERRTLIVYILLGLAVSGGALRLWAPNPSLARDIGSLLLVLWVPVIGNVVGFVARKLRLGPGPSPDFEAGSPFIAHLEVEMTPLAQAVPPADQRENRCALVLGKDAFTVRMPVPLAQWLDGAHVTELECLRPALALPRLAAGTPFHVLAGQSIIGQGRVLGARPAPPTADGGIG